MSVLETEINRVNTLLVTKNFDQQKTLSGIYKKMGDAVETHKLTITTLIDLAQNMGYADETIIKQMDDSVELLLTTIDTLAKTPKDNSSGLGGQILPNTITDDTIIYPTDTVFNGYRLPMPSGLLVYISLLPPTITFKYASTNINFPPSLTSYTITNSTNINVPASSAINSSNIIPNNIGPLLSLTLVDFSEKMQQEIIKLSAISGNLYFEEDRFNDLADRYRNIALTLKLIST